MKVEPLYENIFQYIAVALLIGLMIALASYALGFSKEQRARRRDAKLAFIALLETDLNNILRSKKDAREVLVGKEDTYQKAMEAFRKYLLFWQVCGFDKAWKEFFYHPENTTIPYLQQYMDFGSIDKREVCHSVLCSRIYTLLSYAKVQP